MGPGQVENLSPGEGAKGRQGAEAGCSLDVWEVTNLSLALASLLLCTSVAWVLLQYFATILPLR